MPSLKIEFVEGISSLSISEKLRRLAEILEASEMPASGSSLDFSWIFDEKSHKICNISSEYISVEEMFSMTQEELMYCNKKLNSTEAAKVLGICFALGLSDKSNSELKECKHSTLIGLLKYNGFDKSIIGD